MTSIITHIGFDADDTLWHSENFYQSTEKRFFEIVLRHSSNKTEDLQGVLYEAERRNLSLFGYGAKGLTLSMVESAIEATRGAINAEGIQEILDLGKELLQHPVDLLPGVREVLLELSGSYQLLLITKGDLFHQETKIAQSQVAELFHRIDIVSEKDAATYGKLLRNLGIDPQNFLMVGNSLRSDVEPVLAIGGHGVHIPYEVTWEHEKGTSAELPDVPVLSSISELPFTLSEIENRLRAATSAFTARA